MRLVLWNLNHRVSKKVIPETTFETLRYLRPHLVVLTEYVEGPSHAEMLRTLEGLGLAGVLLSPRIDGGNQVLVAGRSPASPGDLRAPPVRSLQSNSLHAVFAESGLQVLAVRMPAYTKDVAAQRRAVWDWIDACADELAGGAAILAGDLNTDPGRRGPEGGARLNALVGRGWSHALPTDGYSWWDLRGRGYRLDHVFVSAAFRVAESRYIADLDGRSLVGKRRGFPSDHAAALVELESIR